LPIESRFVGCARAMCRVLLTEPVYLVYRSLHHGECIDEAGYITSPSSFSSMKGVSIDSTPRESQSSFSIEVW
jgi:hypothetical protein